MTGDIKTQNLGCTDGKYWKETQGEDNHIQAKGKNTILSRTKPVDTLFWDF